MPADITGTNIIVKTTQGNAFEFQPGPLFASIVLADEINRATPKTQSALLEAMQEHCVTVAGVSRPMKEPYFVLATQNPVEQEGTYPLPEAQLDRFLFKVLVPFPTLEELGEIVQLTTTGEEKTAQKAADGDTILRLARHCARGARGPRCAAVCPEAGAGHASRASRQPGDSPLLPALWRKPPRGAGHFQRCPRARADAGTLQCIL